MHFVKQDHRNKGHEHNRDMQLTSRVDVESIDDRSKIVIFVKHPPSVDLKSLILPKQVILVRGATRKISNIIDIYVQMQLNMHNLILLGTVSKAINEFHATHSITLIRQIPNDALCRYIVKLSCMILDVLFVKIRYQCDVCYSELQNEHICQSGCSVKQPQLVMFATCLIQDGTAKATLELKNKLVHEAFNLQEHELELFKAYCLKNGAFLHPSKMYSHEYRTIFDLFKRSESFKQIIVYAKPYSKAGIENGKNNLGSGTSAKGRYQQTISKPSFMANTGVGEKGEDIFLNGEIPKRAVEHWEKQRQWTKKPALSFRSLHIEPQMGSEATTNAKVVKNLFGL